MRCDEGYEPSGCHVIRYSHKEGRWNHDVPICQKGEDMSESNIPPLKKQKQIQKQNKANKNNKKKTETKTNKQNQNRNKQQ